MAVSLGLARIYVTFIVTNPLKSLQIRLFGTFLEVMERVSIEVTRGEGPLGVPPVACMVSAQNFAYSLLSTYPLKLPLKLLLNAEE